MLTARRLQLASIIIAVGCLTGMAISHRLWIGINRGFPKAPMFGGLSAIAWIWEAAIVSMFIACIIGALMGPLNWRTRLTWLGVGTAIVMMALDQIRMQPWFLQYLLMWMVLASRSSKRVDADNQMVLSALRIIIACMYIFSGLHKINASFFAETARLVIEPVARMLPEGTPLEFVGYMMPALEGLIGVGLLLPRARTAAVCIAVLMHVSILLLIGPLGINHNEVVWPWNVAMIALVIVLFWGPDDRAPVSAPSGTCTWIRRLVIVLAAIIPIGGLIGWVDVYLSWGMYAGVPPVGALELSPSMVVRLPEHIRERVEIRAGGTNAIFLYEWSFDDLKVFYPEERILRAAARDLVPLMRAPDDMYLHVIPRPDRWSSDRIRKTVPLEQFAGSNAPAFSSPQ